MKKEIGLWIDHREAIIVTLTGDAQEIRHIKSGSAKHGRASGSPAGPRQVIPEDQRDRKLGNELNTYYDEVAAAIHDAESIQIFGPGEAKGELEKRIEYNGLKARVLTIETADKMTDRQISAKVREHFAA